jgi:hypothetical protein
MITGQLVGRTFANAMFAGADKLISTRESLVNNTQMTMYYTKSYNTYDNKVGRKIISNDFSITAYPYLKQYDSIRLIGSFDVDAEGVKPPDSLVLVERGILKTLLNGRTPTKAIDTTNGHFRFAITLRGINTQIAPGVVHVVSEKRKRGEQLLDDLKEQAEMNGLQFAFIAKPMVPGNNYSPVMFYKYHINTGKEELINGINISAIQTKSLRRILSSSDTETVYNVILNNGKGGVALEGVPVSVITPDALVVEEVDFEGNSKVITENKNIVPKP